MNYVALGANVQTLSILFSGVIVIACYVFLSRREGNYINVLTPVMLFNLPAWYFLELLYDSIFGIQGSAFAYAFCYAAYAGGVVAMLWGYLAFPQKAWSLLIRVPTFRIPGMSFALLLVGIALYVPILIQYAGLITTPREIYTATRTGYGPEFFLSAVAVYLGFIVLLFRRHSWGSLSIYLGIGLLLLYLHGSKVEVLALFLIGLYYVVFVKQWPVSLRRFVLIGFTAASVAVGLFYLTFSAADRADLLTSIASYADYTRNAAIVIDDKTLTPQLGRLTAETEFYTMIPRVLFPNKPNDYGAFWLVERYFPERFLSDTGAPDFGLGLLYADFGIFSLAYYVFGSFLVGGVLRILVSRLARDADAGTFTLLLALLQVPLLPVGGTVPLVVYYLLAHVAKILGGYLYKAVRAYDGPGVLELRSAGRMLRIGDGR